MNRVKTKDEIKTDIVDSLVWDGRVLSTDVTVDVDQDGNVTLSGTVPNFQARRAAMEDAWFIDGVKSVENKIEVEYPSTIAIPSDSQIQSNITNALLWNSSINSTKVDVTVNGGFVTLEGSVDSYWSKALAESIAGDITGVLNVENKLAVVPSEKYTDEAVAEDIVEEIDRRPEVDVENVNVKVENGEATLTGSVPSYNAWSAAFDSAFYTVGVKEVSDKVKIE